MEVICVVVEEEILELCRQRLVNVLVLEYCLRFESLVTNLTTKSIPVSEGDSVLVLIVIGDTEFACAVRTHKLEVLSQS